ncbi:hypothetical protein JMJ35_006493 [Cladonia borealis]|uniref:NADPH-dependent FMN reductase-like domain-containing protein n=1 Tax=Cladonia borealis TaxID=184061 RepID=A0AA39U919_9LECA|nr:hypothetical protein JMJ35_006493 [Cladonia borealis]
MSTPITTPHTAPPTSPSSPPPPSIALIIASTRQPCVAPQIASFLTHLYTTYTHTHPSSPPLTTIDLLPLSTEPLLPSLITTPSQYTHAHTRSWSALTSSFSAFLFL